MAVPAVVNAAELQRIATASYVNRNFKVCLVDAPGSTFDADDPFATVMAGEVQAGLGGYARQQIGFTAADLGLFNSGRIDFARKAATFTHNGALGQVIRFSHVVLLNPTENGILAVRRLSSRATLSDSQAAIFYFDFTLYGVFVAS